MTSVKEQNKGLAEKLGQCQLYVHEGRFFHGNVLVPTDLLGEVIAALRAQRKPSGK